jgi:hypothetical protein
MKITARIQITELSPDQFSAAFALYVGDNQLFPYETLQATYPMSIKAQFAASEAVADKIDALRTAEVEVETERQ